MYEALICAKSRVHCGKLTLPLVPVIKNRAQPSFFPISPINFAHFHSHPSTLAQPLPPTRLLVTPDSAVLKISGHAGLPLPGLQVYSILARLVHNLNALNRTLLFLQQAL